MFVLMIVVVIIVIILITKSRNNDGIVGEKINTETKEILEKMSLPVSPVTEEGIDIYLFIEYSRKNGYLGEDLYTSSLGYPIPIRGHEAYPLDEYIGGFIKSFIMALASGADLKKARISVNISYGSDKCTQIQPLTNDINRLFDCISPNDIYYKENGGKFIPNSIIIKAPYTELLSLVSKNSNLYPKRKAIGIILTQGFRTFGGCTEEYQKEIIQEFEKCCKKQMEVITLGLKPEYFEFRDVKEAINIDLLERCSTMPELTRICNYEKMTIYLKELGQKLSNIN